MEGGGENTNNRRRGHADPSDTARGNPNNNTNGPHDNSPPPHGQRGSQNQRRRRRGGGRGRGTASENQVDTRPIEASEGPLARSHQTAGAAHRAAEAGSASPSSPSLPTSMEALLHAVAYVPLSQRQRAQNDPQQPQTSSSSAPPQAAANSHNTRGRNKPSQRGGGGRGKGEAPRHNTVKAPPSRPLPPPQVGNLDALPTRAHDLADALITRTYECMNCLEIIDLETAVWSCTCCYSIFHLSCIQRWAKEDSSHVDSSTTRRATLTAPSTTAAAAGPCFRCPQCRFSQLTSSSQNYKCFCGKAGRPPYDPFIIPHSCGATCGKPRVNAAAAAAGGGSCPHTCPLQCHPGPCAECAVVIGNQPCPCGSTTYSYRCGEPDPHTTCNNSCGKLLACGKHRCERTCHTGDCGTCEVLVPTTCLCGKEKDQMRPCGDTSIFRCGRRCNKVLSCGNHRCSAVCHDGECPLCPLDVSVVDTCPCGARLLSSLVGAVPRTSCTDPIACCNGVCGKVLACGRHTCQERCHEGDCPPCTQRVNAACRCRLTKKLVPCADVDEVRCTRLCGTKFSCGHHYCREVCCPDRGNPSAESHICLATCEKKLPCGHRCTELCHSGACPPCVHFVTDTLVCACGRTQLPPPQPCGTTAPRCPFPCQRASACGHPPATHRCHYGDCPPCMTEVPRVCVGGHAQDVMRPCSEDPAAAVCEQVCGKPLACGHLCSRTCHPGPCVGPGLVCKEACGKPHTDCSHSCEASCHVPDPCPPCRSAVKLTCKCGNVRRTVPCQRARKMVEDGEATLLSSTTTRTAQGIEAAAYSESDEERERESWAKDDAEYTVGVSDFFLRPRRVLLPCSDNCFYRNRLNTFATLANLPSRGQGPAPATTVGAATMNSHHTSRASPAFYYPIALWELAEAGRTWDYIEQAEKRLRAFAEGTESIAMMPPMKAEKRAVFHLLAPYYGVECASIDAGPARSVMLSRAGTGGVAPEGLPLPEPPHSSAAPLPPVTVRQALADAKHNPVTFFERATEGNGSGACLQLEDDGVTERFVVGFLRSLAGQYVYGGEAAAPQGGATRATLVFKNEGVLKEASALLRKKGFPFRFWVS